MQWWFYIIKVARWHNHQHYEAGGIWILEIKFPHHSFAQLDYYVVLKPRLFAESSFLLESKFWENKFQESELFSDI
jgi:hypothetical protein